MSVLKGIYSKGITVVILTIMLFGTGCSSNVTYNQCPEGGTNETRTGGIAYFPLEGKLKLEDGKFIFTIKNQNERPEKLEFSSALEHDYMVINENGEVVKQHSKNVMSAQRIKTITLKQAEELVYKGDYDQVVKGLPKGSYTIEFSSTAKGKKIFSTLEIEVH